MSAAAFCKARRKLKPEVVRSLVRQAARAFDKEHGPGHRIKNRRVIALDGCKFPVQRATELWDEFRSQTGGHCPQAMVSVLYDAVARIPIDATIEPCNGSERDQLEPLIDNLKPPDILLLDRGYPSYEIFDLLRRRSLDFVVRVPTQFSFAAVHQFLDSEAVDDVILLQARRHQKSWFEPLKVRAVRHEGPDGEPQVFLTSLSSSAFRRQEIVSLYGRRWEIELFYRLEKGDYVGHRQFHARDADGVRQEVFAFLLHAIFVRHFMSAAATIHEVPYQDVSQKGAYLAVCDNLVRLLLLSKPPEAEQLLRRVVHRVSRLTEKKRQRPSYPRRSYRPRRRWGPLGHTPPVRKR